MVNLKSKTTAALRRLLTGAGFATLALLHACGGGGNEALTPVQLAAACPGLTGQAVAAADIGLPTTGATVAAASVVASTASTPEYCKVTGAIAPATAGGLPINFQVNLPTTWSGKAVHYGGSGLNGTVVTGLAPLRSASPAMQLPIALGYATFGSDSGHSSPPGVSPPTWALNDEALANFAYASMKKTRDVAVGLMARLYGQGPRRTYFAGSSEGGREALTVVQRYPGDYDGVVAVVPVIPWVALQSQGNRVSTALRQPGAWINPAKVTLLSNATLATCDAADGLADGIIGKALSCSFDPSTLRCPGGTDTGNTCLSDAQINALNVIHSPLQLGFSLTNGSTSYPGWEWGGEGLGVLDNFSFWQTGNAAPAPDPGGVVPVFGDFFARYFVTRDANFDVSTFAPSAYTQRMRDLSAILDADNPDLSTFRARGGKLLLKEATADYAQSPFAGVGYYNRVVGSMGQAAVDSFMRFYVTPGVTHMGLGGPDFVDLLAVLDAWVDQGQAPADPLVQVAVDPTTFAVTRSRPMCRYPAYPRYNGSGDVNLASSFSCSTN